MRIAARWEGGRVQHWLRDRSAASTLATYVRLLDSTLPDPLDLSSSYYVSYRAGSNAETVVAGDVIEPQAITTVTTVGYGHIRPKTPEGKVLAVLVMLVGIATATLVIGAVAERFLSREVREVEETESDVLGEVREITTRLSQLERRLHRERQVRT
jgi:hypothetical protein